MLLGGRCLFCIWSAPPCIPHGVLDRNNLFDKKIYKISLETKVIAKIVRNTAVMDNDNWNYKIDKYRCP